MKKIFTLFVLALFLSFSVQTIAQISQGGLPESFPKAGIIKPLVYTNMQYVNVAMLQAEDLMLDTLKSFPWRFGDNLEVDLGTQNSGVWDTLNDGSKIWRLGIRSAGALTINLTFDKYVLPPGARFYVYNSSKTEVIGAFTDFNNQADSAFATTLVRGDSIIVEYNEPAIVAFTGIIHLQRVTHGYRSAYDYAKSFGSAGTCQINVACPTGVGWENEVRSVCMLVSGSNGFCTGFLVNNTANDGTPYVQTANHCYSNPSTWIFWFNWQSATCTNPGSSPAYNSISGATLRARTTTSDFCLVEMSSVPPLNYNVFYAGWNRTTTPPPSGMGIHHPSGDIKKISPAGQMVNYGAYDAGNGAADCWQVPWSGLACTEGGSSGSPIFDENHLVVGQLYGGPSACGQSQGNMHDFYGRFCTSWTGDGTSATRLSDWLDPLSINPTSYQGYDPNGPLPPVANFTASPTTSCTGVIQFTDASSASPISWAWNFGDGGTSTLQNPTHTYTSSGVFTVTLIATNSISSDTATLTNYITINLPTAPTTTGASNCGPGSVTLSASGNGTIEWYTAPTGGALVATGTSYTTPVLTSTTTYYVQDSVPAPSQYVGETNNTSNGSMFNNYPLHYLVFDCYSAVTLVSVEVNAGSAANRTILLQNSSGTTLQSATIYIPAGISRITLNFNIPVEAGLRLVGPTYPDLFRNSSNCSYPYTLAGLISILYSSASTTPTDYYYYFYDWEVKGDACISSRTPVTATINTPSVAGVSITANPSGAICAGTSVTFTATPANGGTNPTYQWKNNGVIISGATNSMYTSAMLANNDVITCVMTSNTACISGSPATSNAITMSVSVPVNVAVSIAANPTGAVCSGSVVTFTATPFNGGTNPGYQWKKNGANISGATNATYATSALANNDIITCIMSSNATCVIGSPATSNAITMSVNTSVTATVNISANPSGAICAGTTVSFTATETNGGTTPFYQWQINGSNTGSNASTMQSSALNNNDIVTCIMTSNAICVASNPVTSNVFTTIISSYVTPAVSISASPSTTTCVGTNVTFTANPVYGGITPVYVWQVNGSTVGVNASTYSSASLITGDVVTCLMTSDESCATGGAVTSNPLTINIASSISAVVLISANPGINICSGTGVTFAATPYNGGTPSYQWYINGSAVGTNNSTYFTSTLADNDVINCIMTSSESCATNNPATSNSLTVNLNPILNSTVTISANPSGIICYGTTVTFTTSLFNGGTSPVYQWQLNGVNVGSNSPVYINSSLNDGDAVNCLMISSLNCVIPNPAISNTYNAVVNVSPATPTITQNGDTLISSEPFGNQWYFHDAFGSYLLAGETGQTLIPLVTGDYFTLVSNLFGCVSDTSNIINVVIVGIDEPAYTTVHIYPNPVTNSLFVDFTVGLAGNTEFEIINYLGQQVIKEVYANIARDAIIQFDMSDFPKGIYFIRIRNEHLFQMEKLLLD